MNIKEFMKKAKILYDLQCEFQKELERNAIFRLDKMISYDKNRGIDVVCLQGEDKGGDFDSVEIALDLSENENVSVLDAISITNERVENKRIEEETKSRKIIDERDKERRRELYEKLKKEFEIS